MERLTSKETRQQMIDHLNPYHVNATIELTQKQFFDMYDKLLLFEDFMEEQGFERLEDFKTELKKCKHRWEKLKEIIKENCDIYKNNADSLVLLLGAYGAEALGDIILEKMKELEGELKCHQE